MLKAFVSQSNYIPWFGFFDAIASVDKYLALDCVQYTRRDWRNRNQILTASGKIWLSIPVQNKEHYDQTIFETLVSDTSWSQKHWKSIEQNYAKAPCFAETRDRIHGLYLQASKMQKLTDINLLFIKEICKILQIKTEVLLFTDFDVVDEKSQRILSLCQQMGATDYCSGPSAKGYLNEDLFSAANIQVHYFDFSKYQPYPQVYKPGSVHVSILDSLFNLGVAGCISRLGQCLSL